MPCQMRLMSLQIPLLKSPFLTSKERWRSSRLISLILPLASYPSKRSAGRLRRFMAALVHSVVARAFGVTPTTVSLLAGCLPYDPDPGRRAYDPETKTYIGGYQGLSRNRVEGRKQHYQDVAKEFIALGEHAFNERYYRPFHERLWKARNEITARHVTAKPRLAGPNPAADKYSFRITRKTINMHGEHWRVSWVAHRTEPTQSGWKIGPCQENGERLETGWSWRGDDTNADLPFRTSLKPSMACTPSTAESRPVPSQAGRAGNLKNPLDKDRE